MRCETNKNYKIIALGGTVPYHQDNFIQPNCFKIFLPTSYNIYERIWLGTKVRRKNIILGLISNIRAQNSCLAENWIYLVTFRLCELCWAIIFFKPKFWHNSLPFIGITWTKVDLTPIKPVLGKKKCITKDISWIVLAIQILNTPLQLVYNFFLVKIDIFFIYFTAWKRVTYSAVSLIPFHKLGQHK